MARISEAEIERLKREVAVEELVRRKGVELRRHGRDLIGLCPFHDDHEPSLVVTPEKNLWHCFGACQTGGSVIDWVKKAEGVSFRHAVELLRAGASAAATSKPPVKQSTVQKLEAPMAASAADGEVLRKVVAYYHATLKSSPDALGYLERRGLGSSEMLDRFELGFANRTLGYRLPAKNRRAGAELRGQLQRVGILRPSGHEHFNGSVVVPVFDERGQVVEMYGRKVGDSLRAGTPLHLYLPGSDGRGRGVWNLEAVAASKEIILCESLLDALTFWCAGYRHVTSSYGVEGFTAEHMETFERYGTERVLVAYDRDAAGDKAASKLAEKLAAKGMSIYRVQFPKGMDANEYALSVKPAQKSLGIALRQASWMAGKERATSVAISRDAAAEAGERKAAQAAADVRAMPSGIEAAAERSGPPSSLAAEPPLPTAASPIPPAPANEPLAEVRESEVRFELGDRSWRVRGLEKNTSYEVLRVNVLCSRGEAFHVDTFDLYSARHRAGFIKQASIELGVEVDVLKRDIGKVLLELEGLQDERIKAALEPLVKVPAMSGEEREDALELLKEPKLLDRILADFERCGVVGEETNKLLGYLASVSRKLEDPLAVIVQSSSAAGKSSLMDAILAFLPSEERVKYSAMTGQSLFYMGEQDLKHKVLAIVEEEGAERAAYALKLLQSEGELTIASTGKDPATGRLITHEYRVEGPVMIFLTTTAIEIDDELLNRCVVLTVNEEREQTRAIHRMQRRAQTLEGLLERHGRDEVLRVHQNAQRLLRPLLVANPFAEKLRFIDERTRTRRDHMKYLTLIRSIALLHQYQRPVRTVAHGGRELEYIEVMAEDIALANRLTHEAMGRSLDELPPQTRRLLVLLDELVREACKAQGIERADYRFTRREVREKTGWGNTQVKVHMQRLEELEYVLVHRGRRGQQLWYELAYDGEGQDGAPFVVGLIEPSELEGERDVEGDIESAGHGYDGERSGVEGGKSGSGRPQVGGVSGSGRDARDGARAHGKGVSRDAAGAASKRTSWVEVPASNVVPMLEATLGAR